jgi:hypothetical protein
MKPAWHETGMCNQESSTAATTDAKLLLGLQVVKSRAAQLSPAAGKQATLSEGMHALA